MGRTPRSEFGVSLDELHNDSTTVTFCGAYANATDTRYVKTDFEVEPVYLKAVHRIQALLCVYFFVLLLEALMERQLRQAMQSAEIEALPMYPEGRACRWPTARRVIDLFESVQRHTLQHRRQPVEVLVTDLNRLQRKILKLIGLSSTDYGR